MDTPRRRAPRLPSILSALLSILVLGICLFYTYAMVYLLPYPGLGLRPDWSVEYVTPCGAQTTWCQEHPNSIQAGDQLSVIGNLSYDRFARDRTSVAFEGYQPLDLVPVVLQRNGEERAVLWQMLGPTPGEQLNRLSSPIIFIPFWLAGTIILFLLQPHDLRWRLLIAFNYLTAVWLTIGSYSSSHFASSSVLQHALVWSLLPVYLHLHLSVPSSLGRQRWRYFLPPLYGISGVFAIVELGQALPGKLFYVPLVGAVFGSLALLGYRLRADRSNADRLALRLMLAGIAMALGPGMALTVVAAIVGSSVATMATWMVVFAIPLLPFLYLYAIFKRHLGDLEFRANRFLGLYAYVLVYATAFTVVFVLIGQQLLAVPMESLAFSLIVSMVFMVAALPLRVRFQRAFDRLAYGARYNPDEIIRLFANRIPTALEREALAGLLTREVAPSLLIRQSALYLSTRAGFQLFYAQGLDLPEKLPSANALGPVLETAGRFRLPESEKNGWESGGLSGFDWVRLALPLRVGDQMAGVWLLGRRDPDDFYPQSDIGLLSTLANQIATALENIRLFNETRMAAQQFSLLYDAGLALNSEREPRAQLEVLSRLAMQTLRAERVEFHRYDSSRNELVLELCIGSPAEAIGDLQGLRFSLGQELGLVGQVAERQALLYVPDVATDPRWIVIDPAIRSALWVPVERGGQVRGVLGVFSVHPNRFTPSDERLLVLFANQAAVALENARLFTAEREQRMLAEALRDTAAALNSTLNLDELLDRILVNVSRVVPHDAANIMLLENGAARIVRWRGYEEHGSGNYAVPMYLPHASAARICAIAGDGRPQVVSDIRSDAEWLVLPTLRWVRSYASAPVRVRGKVIGLLNVDSATPGFFTQAHAERLQALADQAAVAIENAQLYDEITSRAAELEVRVAERTADLQKANAKLQELDRLKSQFVSNVSHELRTPLTNIKLYLNLLEKGRQDKRDRYLATLNRETSLLQRLIEDVLDLSRLDLQKAQPELAPLDLNQLLTILLSDREPLAMQAGLELSAQTDPDLPCVMADARMLTQVFGNLLANAINYTPRGGRIWVYSQVYPCDPHRQAEDPSWVSVSVTDTGPGIADEDKEHIFDRFYRGEAGRRHSAPGTGLGLAICKEIVERHAGRITLQSQVGQGSTFTVWLPAMESNVLVPDLVDQIPAIA